MTRVDFHGGKSELMPRAGWAKLLLIGLVISGVSVALAVGPKDQSKRNPRLESVPGEYVVQLKAPIGDMNIRSVSSLIGAPVVDRVQDDIVVVRKSHDGGPAAALKALSRNSAIARVEPNYIYRFNKVPNDPGFGQLWGLKNSGALDSAGMRGLGNVDVGAEKAWDITTGSKDVLVAVIDTGVDHTHPDLAPNIFVNQMEKNGLPGVDDDGNGYIDDIHGYDFVNGDGDPMDDNGHGTHCAGTIGAAGDDGKGLVGVNWNVTIMGIKFLANEGGGTLANAIKSINYAVTMGVDVMNNSWGGGGYSEILKETIRRAGRAGIVFVAAAGNDASDNDRRPSYPASYDVDNVVSVAAVDNRGDLAYFSNYGSKSVHVAAPGHNILSTVPGGTDTYSGTSMATPHVTGVVALMLAYNPRMAYDEVKHRLISTSKPLSALKGRVASAGVVDAFYALVNIKAPPDGNDPSMWTESRDEVIETAHPYVEGTTQRWTVRAPGAKRVSLFFKQFETEAGYDKVVFTNAAGEKLGTWSGRRDGHYSPVADGDTIHLEFTSDSSNNGYGFMADKVVFE